MRLPRLLCDGPDYRQTEGGPEPDQVDDGSPPSRANTLVRSRYRNRASRRPSLVNSGSVRSLNRLKTASHDPGIPKQSRLLYVTAYHCPTCSQQLWERKVVIQRCSIPGHGLACDARDSFAVAMELCRRTEMTDKECGLCRWLAWRAARKRWSGPDLGNTKTTASGNPRTSILSTRESWVANFYQQGGMWETIN